VLVSEFVTPGVHINTQQHILGLKLCLFRLRQRLRWDKLGLFYRKPKTRFFFIMTVDLPVKMAIFQIVQINMVKN
jgi:hypothetical protein